MAPVPSEPFRVLLTGFGPFKTIIVNPSWQAVEPLSGTTLSSRPPPLSSSSKAASPKDDLPTRPTRTIEFTSHLIPTEWDQVLALVPPLHSSEHSPPPDLIVHVGVGLPGALKLEQRGRRFGYDHKVDAKGNGAPGKDGIFGFTGSEWDGEPDERWTRVNGLKVREFVATMGLTALNLSEDAGLYLCEFITFCSLSASGREGGSGVPVQFVHVPQIGYPYSLSELTQAIQLIVWAIVNEGGLEA